VVLHCGGEVPFRSAQTVHSARPRGEQLCRSLHEDAHGTRGSRYHTFIGTVVQVHRSPRSSFHIVDRGCYVHIYCNKTRFNPIQKRRRHRGDLRVICEHQLRQPVTPPSHPHSSSPRVLRLEGADHWQYNRFHKSGRWTRLCLDSFILCTRANGRPRRAMGCARETVSGLSEKILGISYTCLYLVEMNRWDAVDVRQPAVSGIKDCGRFIWGVLSVA